ncbi:MAG: hypothetical protein ACRDPN_14035 [Aeromicrobium sp.]
MIFFSLFGFLACVSTSSLLDSSSTSLLNGECVSDPDESSVEDVSSSVEDVSSSVDDASSSDDGSVCDQLEVAAAAGEARRTLAVTSARATRILLMER